MKRFDIAIVGAGMAGASLAAELAQHASVAIIEAEPMPGYHATGRSAAFWTQSYGGPAVLPLTTASGAYLRDGGFLTARGALHLAAEPDFALLDAFAARFEGTGLELEMLDDAAVGSRIPGLRPGRWKGLFEPSNADIDVAALHAHYLRIAKTRGAELFCSAPLVMAAIEGTAWRVDAGDELAIEARILVNAAGAWADAVARMADVRPLGIQAFRRTMVQLRVAPPAPETLPLVLDIAGRHYFKPEPGGRLWLTPHDETLVAPGDASPEEIDVATGIDRVMRVIDWKVERVERVWAGLRSFALDRLPVFGFDKDVPGFFWFAGQGGFGIQTAPASARLGASLLLGLDPPAGIDPHWYRPTRF